jgi:RHH-type proline utilization regulon transcriptional repressor/proline dehydrogenase/delta 1-pyrroline-5-carboxylate dehydrogenase
MHTLMGLVVREAGKSLPNAVAEMREAVDFLRYYAAQIRSEFSNDTHRPLGPVVCISPWNFPLAIFHGPGRAALAAGNTVLAKPAEQTPLIAAQAVRILREAGVPAGAVQLLPGDGETVGAALVADAAHAGGDVHRFDRSGTPDQQDAGHSSRCRRQADSADRRNRRPERDDRRFVGARRAGGGDVLNSAFDSAGQRCSALRVLCLQDDVADRTLEMLTGAMRELAVGNPDRCRSTSAR